MVKVANRLPVQVNDPGTGGILSVSHLLGPLHDRQELARHIHVSRRLRLRLSSLQPDAVGSHVHMAIPSQGQNLTLPHACEISDCGGNLNVVGPCSPDAEIRLMVAESLSNVVLC